MLIGGGGTVLVVALVLILTALQSQVTFFFSPSDLAARTTPPVGAIRVGGLVQSGSLERTTGNEVRFTLADTAHTVTVSYEGLLPDLFREGQGIIVEGRLGSDGTVEASRVLAKHDETYMPKEVADSLKEQGHWRDESEQYPK
jgi:cytochrome c-type biogenesis protein CcmE